MYCQHKNMVSTARVDYCPDCGYEFYYGDAHASDPTARQSREINPGLPSLPEDEGYDPCPHYDDW